MKVKLVLRLNTPKKKSPSVYATDRGTYLVQGYPVAETYKEQVQDLMDNEDLIEVPADLILLIRDKLDKR
ncbi:hypothetical protein MYX82_04330 [Acidobacteria bacterium AH-259-D05]|nr:hypothetical protein [Acidobacteria bacterium AH-259-D05]